MSTRGRGQNCVREAAGIVQRPKLVRRGQWSDVIARALSQCQQLISLTGSRVHVCRYCQV